MRWTVLATSAALLVMIAIPARAASDLDNVRAGASASVAISIPTLTSVDLRTTGVSVELSVFQTGRDLLVLRFDRARSAEVAVLVSLREGAAWDGVRTTRGGWTMIVDREAGVVSRVSARPQQSSDPGIAYEIWQF